LPKETQQATYALDLAFDEKCLSGTRTERIRAEQMRPAQARFKDVLITTLPSIKEK
jgi:hypothetical protein